MPKPKTDKLNRYIKHPTVGRLRSILDESDPSEICRYFLEKIIEPEIESRPAKARKLIVLAVRLAVAIEDECLKSRVFGALSNYHRSLGRYSKAQRCCSVAAPHCDDCPRCGAILHRHLARLRMSEEAYDAAIDEIKRAIQIGEELGDEDSLGRSLVGRSNAWLLMKRHREALDDTRLALTKLEPDISAHFHAAALHNMCLALAYGSQEDARRALGAFSTIRELYRGKRGLTVERARMRWVEALLCHRVGLSGKAEGLLRRARGAFIRLEMPLEIGAITADLAFVEYPSRRSIRELARETLELEILKGEAFFGEVKAVWESTKTENPFVTGDPDGVILSAVRALRNAIDASSIPSFFLDGPPAEGDPTPVQA